MKNERLNTAVTEAMILAVIITAFMPLTDGALAENLGATVAGLENGISRIPALVTGFYYIGGAALIGAGALKIKMHAENPGQNPLGHGLGRIVAGSTLLAIPAFANWLNNSFNLGTGRFSAATFGPLQ